MATLATLFVRVLADTAAAQKQLAGLGTTMNSAGKTMQTAGMKMTKFVTLPILGAGVAAVTFAADAAEVENKVKVTFGKMSASVIKWSETSLDKMGIAKATAQDMASTFGLLFQAAKLPGPAVTKMSKTFANLAVDMSSFFNIPFEEALTTLRAGLVGETEPLRRFGVLLNEANVAGEAVRIGIAKTGEKLTEQQKVIARSSFIQRALTKATGDYARTAGSTSNQIRTMRERFKEAAATIGQELIPVANKILGWAKTAISRFQGLSDSQKQLVIRIAAVAAAAGPLLFIFGGLIRVLGKFTGIIGGVLGGIGRLAGGLMSLATSMGGGAALAGVFGLALAGIGVAIGLAIKDAIQYKIAVHQLTGAFQSGELTGRHYAEMLNRMEPHLEKGGVHAQVAEKHIRALNEAWRNAAAPTQEAFRSIQGLNAAILDSSKQIPAAVLATIQSALANKDLVTANRLLDIWLPKVSNRLRVQGEHLDAVSSGARNAARDLRTLEAIQKAMEARAKAAAQALAGENNKLGELKDRMDKVPRRVDAKVTVETSAAMARLQSLQDKYRSIKAEIEGTIHVAVTGGKLPNIPKPGGGGGGAAGGGTSPQQFRTLGMAGGGQVLESTTVIQHVYGNVVGSDLTELTAVGVRKARRRRRRL